jgi:outer membrane biosynthesis protein TonB
VLRSSGIPELAQDALAALRRAAPFAPIPPVLGLPRLVVHGTLKYNNPVVP